MLKKMALKLLLHKWKRGGFKVIFWDGDQETYGDEPPSFIIAFKQEPPFEYSSNDIVLLLGEAYMDGIIEIEGSMDDVLRVITLNTFPQKNMTPPKETTDKPDSTVQQRNIHHHYDLGNDFFKLWLDETMSYSCAYFKTPDDSLHQAQLQKIDYILRKIALKPGERLLDIGSGWGWLIIKAAQQYHVQGTGITLSTEQYQGTIQRIKELGLEQQVDVHLVSYQELESSQPRFDKIVSVGMFEHVGQKNLAGYMRKVSELLKPGGISLLHTITGMFEDTSNSWLGKYIFPGGYVPSLRETVWLLPQFDFHLLHAESLRLHYALTIDRWYKNFTDQLDSVRDKYDERFIRMWGLYLRGCAAAFRVSGLDIYQLLFTKGLNNNIPLTYQHLYPETL